MNKISLTASMRSNLLSLQNISGQVSSTQNKLATGNKVNSAIDNPSSYYTARSLNNRADDLNALLDSMGQAVSTIKAATTALESATEFLEQAKAVASQALETAKVPDKSFFEQQEDVAAVVSTWEELKAALDSGKQGNIVIYGNIEAQDTIILKNGQNLVGVGYYGVNEPDTDKFSQLSFDLNTTNSSTAINIEEDGILISDVSIKVVMNKNVGSQTITMKDTQNHTLQNIDIFMDTSKMLTFEEKGIFARGTLYGSFSLKGTCNIYSSNTKAVYVMGFSASTISLENDTVLNAQMNEKHSRIFSDGSRVTLEGAAQLNANTKGIFLENSYLFINDDSEINVLAERSISYIAKNIEVNDRGKFNVWGTKVFWKSESKAPTNFKITSAQAQINFYTTAIFDAVGEIIFNAVKGSQITINNEQYITDTITDKSITSDEYFRAALMQKESTYQRFPFELNELDKKNSTRKNEYKYRKDESSQYQEILNQYDALIKDASYKGINLLQTDKLSVKFNEDNTASLNVQGKDMSSKALGFTTFDWQTQGDINASIEELTSAINAIRNYSSELGNNYNIITTRQDFTESLINVLTEGADKLTLADMNEESANMLALQTRQQLAINSLSLANQASQSILKLF